MSDRMASGATAETAPEKPTSTIKETAGKPAATNGTPALRPGAFDELRNLLVGPEQQTLTDLQQRVSELPAAVADVLPQAVKHSARENSNLSDAMLPVTEENIENSVKRNPRILADALFPIIGPATRKAIAEALGQMVQSLNQTLEHSISVQGLKWRVEAARTGKSFAEVVMLHTLLYRVEQVFLIHRETGLLLQHVAAPGVITQDADMVSGMMTAIQDFVQDSFQGGEEKQSGTLNTLKVGELTVWIEPGPKAILAAVIRGNAPEDLRLIFHQTLERIHTDFGRELKQFEGDSAHFEAVRPELETCLQVQYDAAKDAAKPKKRIKPLHVIGAVLLLAVLVFGFLWIREYRRWSNYVTRLQSEPGLVLISAERGWTKYYVRGLRDPLAAEPQKFVVDAGLNPDKVVAAWEPYHALSSEFVLRRAQHALQPPDGVHLSYKDGVLDAAGIASKEWITESRILARALPGVTTYHDENVVESGRQQFALIRQKLEQLIVKFQDNSTQYAPGQESAINELVAGIQQLHELGPKVTRDFRVQIIGHTDTTGTENVNLQLSRDRAEAIRALLESKLGSAATLEVVAAGTSAPLRTELSDQDKEFNRSVTIKVFVTY